jgi:hypothetical protein
MLGSADVLLFTLLLITTLVALVAVTVSVLVPPVERMDGLAVIVTVGAAAVTVTVAVAVTLPPTPVAVAV